MKREEFYKNPRSDLSGPLHGVTVVEATTTWAGPMASCILADLGATVIKVEHPQGEVIRRLPPTVPDTNLTVANETVNRNKQNVSLDLQAEGGRELFLQLIKTADIMIENFRPGTMAKWGVGYDDIAAVKPDIIYVSVSGFGQFGELSDRVGYDPIAQNYCGWTSLNGEPEGGPIKAPTFLGDDIVGLHGALGALAALRHRDQTGEGQHVDVALIDCLLFQSDGFPTCGALGIDLPRTGNEFTIAAPVNNYPCEDGNVFCGVLLDTHWKLLSKEMGREDLEQMGALERLQNRELLDGLLAYYCAQRTVADVVDKFAELGLPATRVNTYAEVVKEPHVQSRDMLVSTETSNGQTLPLVGPPVKFSRTPTTIRQHAPVLGAHTEETLQQLGCSAETIKDLRERGVI